MKYEALANARFSDLPDERIYCGTDERESKDGNIAAASISFERERG